MAEVILDYAKGGSGGVAPFDAVERPRWAAWRVAVAYLILSAVAVGSIWVIDGHVLQATESKDHPARLKGDRDHLDLSGNRRVQGR